MVNLFIGLNYPTDYLKDGIKIIRVDLIGYYYFFGVDLGLYSFKIWGIKIIDSKSRVTVELR